MDWFQIFTINSQKADVSSRVGFSRWFLCNHECVIEKKKIKPSRNICQINHTSTRTCNQRCLASMPDTNMKISVQKSRDFCRLLPPFCSLHVYKWISRLDTSTELRKVPKRTCELPVCPNMADKNVSLVWLAPSLRSARFRALPHISLISLIIISLISLIDINNTTYPQEIQVSFDEASSEENLWLDFHF